MRSTRRASSADQPVTRSNSWLSRSTRVSGWYIVIMTGIRSMMVCSSEISRSRLQARAATISVMSAIVAMKACRTSRAWRGGSGANGPKPRSVPWTAMAARTTSSEAASRRPNR
jgi:hypothetical protein